jgi:SprT protein
MTAKWHEPNAVEDQHHVDDWVRFACECNQVPDLAQMILVEWNPRFTRRLGDGYYNNRVLLGARIRLSLPLWPRASEEDRRETVIHETCHVVVGLKFGRQARHHGPEWRQAMKNCGVEPLRTHSVDRTGLVRRQKQFILLGCPHSEMGHKCRITARQANLLRRGQEFHCTVCDLHLDSKTDLEEVRTATVQNL